MKGPQIHDAGAKAPRDRAKIMGKYVELCEFMRVPRLADAEIARLSNMEFYRLCEDIYNRQPNRKKIAYAESIGATPRSNPTAFKWFLSDLLQFKAARGPRRAWLVVTSPFRYPAFLIRRKRRLAAEAKQAAATMSAAAAPEPDPEAHKAAQA